MRVYITAFFVVFLGINCAVFAQDVKDEIIERLLENIEDEGEVDYATLIQELYELYENPLNINETTVEELEVLPMLSDIDVINLLNYRENIGKIYTLYELHAIEGFTPEKIQSLAHFITFETAKEENTLRNFKRKLKYASNNIMLRAQRIIEEPYGYKERRQEDFENAKDYENWENKRYLGSPWRYYLRYETHYKDQFKIGLVSEKDPGEAFFSGTQKRGFDHYSGFIQINKIGILKTAIVGDYLPRFGQGLATWGGYNIGKSAYFLNVNKRNEGIYKYASSNENEFMRGVAVTVEPYKKMLFTAYYSNKKIDGNVQATTDLDDEERFTSFLNSGYHRSYNELSKRKTIGEEIWGLNATFKYKNLKVGANFIDYQFSKSFVGGNTLRDLYDFSGTHGLNYSIYGNYRIDRAYFFGEAALDKNNAKAFLCGAIFNASEQFNFSMLYRDYAKDYQALYASGFGDKQGTNNEKGWYFGMEMLPLAKWKLSAYFDVYEFPWLRTGVDAPARGYDYKLRVAYTHSENFDAYGQFYFETNQRNTSDSTQNLRFLTDEKRKKLRLQVNYQVVPNLYFRDRGELAFYFKEDKKTKGFVLFHDIIYNNPMFPVTFSMRYALFDVEDYNSRIYTYENDVLYAFSTLALQNKGDRFYLNAKWRINEHFTLWAKYGITRYSDKNEINSGLNLIDKNHIQEVKFQIRYKF